MTEQQKLTFTALQQRLDSLMLRDRLRFSRRLHGVKKVKNPDAQQAIFQEAFIFSLKISTFASGRESPAA